VTERFDASVRLQRKEYDISNVNELDAELLPLQSGACSVDFSGVDYIDSTGLSALVRAYKRVQATGGGIALLNLQPRLRKLFDITSLNELFTFE